MRRVWEETTKLILSESYADFFRRNSKKRYLILYGGTRAGKTYAILQLLLTHAIRKSMCRISVVSIAFPHLRRGALRDFEDMIAQMKLQVDYHKTNHTFLFSNGSFIEFFSVDQSAKVRGAQRDVLFINEANLISFDAFSELDVRTKSFVLMDFNPVGRFWLNEFYDSHEHKDAFAWGRFTYRDNPYLTAEQIFAIESRRNDPRWWRVYGEGEWGEASGQAWYNFEVVDAMPPEAQLEAIGVDFGFTQSPTAVVSVWKLGNEVYVREEVYRPSMRLEELVAVLRRFQNAKRIVGDAAQRDIIAQLRKEYSIPIVPSRKLELRASFAMLNAQKVKIVSPSPNLLKEAYSLAWEGDRLLAVDDHAIDAMRYALQTKAL